MKARLDFPFEVLGKQWTVRLLTDKYYRKKNGKDSCAITKVHKRRIELRPKYLDWETVAHELTHAYKYEMCLHSTISVGEDDWEEFVCELVAKRGREIVELSDKLHAQIQSALKGAQ